MAKWRGIILESESALESDEDPVFNRFIKSRLLSAHRVERGTYELKYLDLRSQQEFDGLVSTNKMKLLYNAIGSKASILLAEGVKRRDDVAELFLLACFLLTKEREEFLDNEPNLYRSDLERTDFKNMTDI